MGECYIVTAVFCIMGTKFWHAMNPLIRSLIEELCLRNFVLNFFFQQRTTKIAYGLKHILIKFYLVEYKVGIIVSAECICSGITHTHH